jgi:hypothetical protein
LPTPTAAEKQNALSPSDARPPAATPVKAAVADGAEKQHSEVRQNESSPDHLVEYLSKPTADSQWIRTFVEKYYLSGDALDDSQVRHIYAERVDYFGREVPLKDVARQKMDYYHQWPGRNYAMIPGTLTISWKSALLANVTFNYRFKVKSRKDLVSAGRGRAVLTIDFSAPAARIVREDGEVLANNLR